MRVPLPAAMITTSIAAMCLFLTWRKIIGELCSPALRKLRLALIPLLFSLAGCSFVQTVYNQSHELVYWWVDSYVDLQGEQRQTVPADLLAFQQWHRQEQLPQYVLWLQAMQTMARHGLHGLQPEDVLRQLLLPVPLLKGQQVGRYGLALFTLQVHITVHPPIHQFMALVVNRLHKAATRQTEQQGDQCKAQLSQGRAAKLADNLSPSEEQTHGSN